MNILNNGHPRRPNEDTNDDGGDAAFDPWKELGIEDMGIPRPEQKDDSLAPPIDAQARETLRAYAKNELSTEEAARILQLTLEFESWRAAMREIYRDLAREEGKEQ